MIKAILACDNGGGVSKDGTIPWPKNTKDLGWFKKNTINNVVVMGSKTWTDPLMPWPLPNRVNVLATTREKEFPGADKYICGDLNKKLKTLRKDLDKESSFKECEWVHIQIADKLKETLICSSTSFERERQLNRIRNKNIKGIQNYIKKAGKFPYLLLGGGLLINR